MAVAIAYDEAKSNQNRVHGDSIKGTKGGVLITRFFGSRDNPDFPYAGLSHRDPGRITYPHYHTRDQFQVIVDGKGTLGRHELAPYCVHFARAYTPYGPLASATAPFTAFVLRAHYDPGSQHLPQALPLLKQVPDRKPWQITRPVTFPILQSGTAAVDAMLQPVSDIKDDIGLAAYTLSMKPNARCSAPDPSQGDGQYLVVVKGSLLHDNKTHNALALVFVWPKDGAYQIHAGPQGLEAIVLNFPRPRAAVTDTIKHVQSIGDFKTWQCSLCAFVYNEAEGLSEEGIPAGTRWKDVPATWCCPDCSASKADFQMVELHK